jgi:hypothetical protein
VIDRLRCIQNCRNWDAQLWHDRSTSASAACSGNSDGGKNPVAGYVGPLTVAQLKTLCTAVPGDARCNLDAGASAAGTSDSNKPKEVASNDAGAANGDGGKAHSAKVCAHKDDVLDAGADCVPAQD